MPEREALGEFATEVKERCGVGIVFRAFGHDIHAEIVGKSDDGAQQHRPGSLGIGAYK